MDCKGTKKNVNSKKKLCFSFAFSLIISNFATSMLQKKEKNHSYKK